MSKKQASEETLDKFVHIDFWSKKNSNKSNVLAAMEEYASTVAKEAVKEKDIELNNSRMFHGSELEISERKNNQLYDAYGKIESLEKDIEELKAQLSRIKEEWNPSTIDIWNELEFARLEIKDLKLRVEEEKINLWQNNPSVHPLTCGNDSRHTPLLTKQVDGKTILYCKDCDYIQNYIPFEVGDTEKAGEDKRSITLSGLLSIGFEKVPSYSVVVGYDNPFDLRISVTGQVNPTYLVIEGKGFEQDVAIGNSIELIMFDQEEKEIQSRLLLDEFGEHWTTCRIKKLLSALGNERFEGIKSDA